MTDEEKQKYKEAKNKRDRERYNKMTDKEKQKIKKKYKDLPEEQNKNEEIIKNNIQKFIIFSNYKRV